MRQRVNATPTIGMMDKQPTAAGFIQLPAMEKLDLDDNNILGKHL